MGTTPTTARGWWQKKHLPKLLDRDCGWESKATWDYNCVGFAVGDFRWWHHEEADEYFWPDEIPRKRWVDHYVLALSTVEFEETAVAEFEPRFDKIAVFQLGGLFTHVARQMSATKWASKLGDFEDTTHPFNAMVGGSYGKFFKFLKRPAVPWRVPERYLVNPANSGP